MNISVAEISVSYAQSVTVTDDTLAVELADGRAISLPLAWYPRLAYATPQERNNWRLIGGGEGIHWPDLDEDLSVAGLLAGRKSGESPQSLARWLNARQSGQNLTSAALPPDADDRRL